MNPYTDTTFFEFMGLFFTRLFQAVPMAQDELQVYTLSLIALSSALVGTFLVLRHMCMLANSLSHTILTGIVIAFIIHRFLGYLPDDTSFSSLLPSETILFVSAIATAFLTAYLTEVLVSSMRMKEDAATGIVFSFLFSLGILLVTIICKNAHIGAELVMGNADVLTAEDLRLSAQIACLNVVLVVIFFRPLFYTTFDPLFSSIVGIWPWLFRYLIMAQLAVTAVSAFRAVGVLMVIAFLVTPPIIARRFTAKLPFVVIGASCIGVFATLVSVALSRHILTTTGTACSTSAMTVVVLACLLAITFVCGKKITNNRVAAA